MCNKCLSVYSFLGEDVEDYLLEHGQLKKMTPLGVHLFFKKFNKTLHLQCPWYCLKHSVNVNSFNLANKFMK